MMIVALLLLCTVVFVIAVYSCSIPSIRGLSDLQKFYSCSTIAGLSWCFLVSWPADELLCSLKWRGRAYTLFDEGIGFSPLVNICFYVALIPELLSILPPFSRLFNVLIMLSCDCVDGKKSVGNIRKMSSHGMPGGDA